MRIIVPNRFAPADRLKISFDKGKCRHLGVFAFGRDFIEKFF